MAQYRYLFYDLLTNTLKAELPLSGVQFGQVLNNSGGFRGSISARHSKANSDNITPGLTAIYVERNGGIIWGGILWRVQTQSGTEKSTVSLSANEFFSYFEDINNRGRYIRDTQSFIDQDQLLIARSLIDYAQNTGTHGASADIGIETGTELTTDMGGVQQLRTVNYNSWDRQNIGQVISNLAGLDNGFEFFISCQYQGNTITKILRLFYPVVTDIPGIILEYPVNILSYTDVLDASKQAKKVDAIGAGEGIDMLITTSQDLSLVQYPMREATFSYKDISIAETLQAQADADLGRVRLPLEIPTLVCRTTTEELRPGAFRCGANVDVRINDGFVHYNNRQRIVQYNVRVDDDGQEDMTLRLNDAEVLT